MPKPILQINKSLLPDEEEVLDAALEVHYELRFVTTGPPLELVPSPDARRLERIATAALQGMLASSRSFADPAEIALRHAAELIAALDKVQQ
jgi:hypothetical protein